MTYWAIAREDSPVHVGLPQHEDQRVVVVDPGFHFRAWKVVHFPVGQFHAFLHSQQCGLVTLLSWKTKPAASDERVLHSFPSPAVVVALVELVLGDQLVQLWVAGLLRYAAGDPLLDPLQYHISVVTPGHGGTFYPQQDVVVRCSAGLVLLLVEVVGHLSKYLTFQNNRVEEVVKLLREFARHRDGVLCAQPPRGIATIHIVHLPQVGGYVFVGG